MNNIINPLLFGVILLIFAFQILMAVTKKNIVVQGLYICLLVLAGILFLFSASTSSGWGIIAIAASWILLVYVKERGKKKAPRDDVNTDSEHTP
jgi:hypothetical protein